MKKLSAALLLCACAGRGPIPTGDKPAWVSTPNGDVRFPSDRFLAAVGSTPVAKKPAAELLAAVDGAARAALAAQLSAAVAAEAQALQTESLAPELLAGLSIQDRWRSEDTTYAWAVFDKASALAAQQARVAAHEKAANDLLAQAAAEASGKPADALRTYARAREEAAAELPAIALVRALGGKADTSAAAGEAEAKVTELLTGLVLNVIAGDQQRATDGAALEEPIVFSAWIKGRRAAGLPMAVSIANGGRAAGVVVGADGKAEVRVESVGKFAQPQQPIEIAVDWAALLGVAADKVPAWIAAQPKAALTATALRKGLDTTRVLVLIPAKADAASVTAALKAAGFGDVQSGEALYAKYGVARISRMSDAQVRDASRRIADVVVFGGRAIDVRSGAILYAPARGLVAAELTEALRKASAP